MAPMSFKCGICNQNCSKTQYSVQCCKCTMYFHAIKCLGISQTDLKKKTVVFTCPRCSILDTNKDTNEDHNNNVSSDADVVLDFSGFADSIKTYIQVQQKELDEQLHKCYALFEESIDKWVAKLRSEFMTHINALKSDIKVGRDIITKVNSDVNKKLDNTESQNNTLRRRLNRADIVINGLPRGIVDLSVPIIKIGSLCGYSLNCSDLQHCCYFAGGKSVLVKFNSVRTRDLIMASYHRRSGILLSDVINSEGTSRIFLNDHLTPNASKLVYECRMMKKVKKIVKYTLINGDTPKAKITFPDGANKILNLDECLSLAAEGSTRFNNDVIIQSNIALQTA